MATRKLKKCIWKTECRSFLVRGNWVIHKTDQMKAVFSAEQNQRWVKWDRGPTFFFNFCIARISNFIVLFTWPLNTAGLCVQSFGLWNLEGKTVQKANHTEGLPKETSEWWPSCKNAFRTEPCPWWLSAIGPWPLMGHRLEAWRVGAAHIHNAGWNSGSYKPSGTISGLNHFSTPPPACFPQTGGPRFSVISCFSIYLCYFHKSKSYKIVIIMTIKIKN